MSDFANISHYRPTSGLRRVDHRGEAFDVDLTEWNVARSGDARPTASRTDFGTTARGESTNVSSYGIIADGKIIWLDGLQPPAWFAAAAEAFLAEVSA